MSKFTFIEHINVLLAFALSRSTCKTFDVQFFNKDRQICIWVDFKCKLKRDKKVKILQCK